MAEFETDEYGEEQVKVDTEIVKCPGCGSNMIFDPDEQMLVCEHCGTKQGFENKVTAEELDLLSGLADSRQWESDEATVFSCDNCGAKVVLKQGETAKICPFCGTSHVQKTEELAGLKPNALIPFAFGDEKAVSFSKNWAKKRIFAPRKFKKTLSAENIKGVYTPCFTFDSRTTSVYYGRIGKHHTRTVGSGKNRRVETYTVWRNISGTYCDSFDDLLVTAGSRFNQQHLNKLMPYRTNDGVKYEEKYLMGFMAYHYDKELASCWDTAKNSIDNILRTRILGQYSYDVVSYLNVSTKHDGVTYKYVMLPVYIGNFKYNKKLYNFYVNGSTGKVTGKTPVSPWRVLTAVLLGLAVVTGIVLLLYFGGFFS